MCKINKKTVSLMFNSALLVRGNYQDIHYPSKTEFFLPSHFMSLSIKEFQQSVHDKN